LLKKKYLKLTGSKFFFFFNYPFGLVVRLLVEEHGHPNEVVSVILIS
jgi:hypothetical protein